MRSGAPRVLRLTVSESTDLDLSFFSAFLYDLVVLHDRIALAMSPEYEKPRWLTEGRYFFSRRARSIIRRGDRLKLGHISRSSPLTVELVLAIAAGVPGAAIVFMKVLQKARDWKEEGRMPRLKREDMELDVARKRLELSLILREAGVRGDEEILEQVAEDVRRVISNQQVELLGVEQAD